MRNFKKSLLFFIFIFTACEVKPLFEYALGFATCAAFNSSVGRLGLWFAANKAYNTQAGKFVTKKAAEITKRRLEKYLLEVDLSSKNQIVSEKVSAPLADSFSDKKSLVEFFQGASQTVVVADSQQKNLLLDGSSKYNYEYKGKANKNGFDYQESYENKQPKMNFDQKATGMFSKIYNTYNDPIKTEAYAQAKVEAERAKGNLKTGMVASGFIGIGLGMSIENYRSQKE